MSNALASAPLDAAAFVKSQIRTVPDWPQAGVQFRDITPLLQHPKTFRVLIDLFVQRYIDAKLGYVAGLDARGFIDQERDGGRAEAGAHVLWRFEVVVSEARERPPLERLQGSERATQERDVALRLHRQEVTREQHEVRCRLDRAASHARGAHHRCA